MKRFLLLIILLLIPFVVKAEDFEYTIKSKVTLEGKELEGNDFTFDLIDSEGNVIQTTTNDKEGNIIFDPITFIASNANERPQEVVTGNSSYSDGPKVKYFFYTIKQKTTNVEGMTYDEEPGYVGVWIFEDGRSQVDYLKGIEKTKKESMEYKVKEGSKIYHATEEELQGQAYAVLNTETKTLTFFRDEEGKYTNEQVIGNNIYYTDFEGPEFNPTWLKQENAYGYVYWDNNLDIKKIIFEDPIRPQRISKGDHYVSSWFARLGSLESIENINLLDTSLVTVMDSLFIDDRVLKELDLSTWDTSNVTSAYGMFAYCYELEKLYMDNFDLHNLTDADLMFHDTYKLKWLNSDLFKIDNLTTAEMMFEGTKILKGLDTRGIVITASRAVGEIAAKMDSLIYLNISTLPSLGSMAIAENPKLAILDLAGEYDRVYTSIAVKGSYWYNLKNNTLYSNNDLIEHLTTIKDLEPATYIRPNNNPEPPIFNNTYVSKEEEKGELIENLLENPSTRDGILFIIAVFLLLGFITINTYKKAKFLN